ncbi:hypothetical protein AB901B6_00291 [Acinetobacter baumannii]|uniref:hypothetical protein n=1 Tax=Acinetobacter baumannii TaxID=470 RepID=UPI0013604F49|nr:hypothetical protein [Acinetobacter baumannii]CAA0156329.1 hypothetical protein AB901B6_00291 [Acinetobacter baumannii]
MKKMFPLGCAGLGIQNSSKERPVSLNEPTILEQFEMALLHKDLKDNTLLI